MKYTTKKMTLGEHPVLTSWSSEDFLYRMHLHQAELEQHSQDEDLTSSLKMTTLSN